MVAEMKLVSRSATTRNMIGLWWRVLQRADLDLSRLGPPSLSPSRMQGGGLCVRPSARPLHHFALYLRVGPVLCWFYSWISRRCSADDANMGLEELLVTVARVAGFVQTGEVGKAGSWGGGSEWWTHERLSGEQCVCVVAHVSWA